MGGALRRYGKQERCIQSLVGRSGGIDRLEYPGVYGRIILIWGFKKWDVGLDWINLT